MRKGRHVTAPHLTRVSPFPAAVAHSGSGRPAAREAAVEAEERVKPGEQRCGRMDWTAVVVGQALGCNPMAARGCMRVVTGAVFPRKCRWVAPQRHFRGLPQLCAWHEVAAVDVCSW